MAASVKVKQKKLYLVKAELTGKELEALYEAIANLDYGVCDELYKALQELIEPE